MATLRTTFLLGVHEIASSLSMSTWSKNQKKHCSRAFSLIGKMPTKNRPELTIYTLIFRATPTFFKRTFSYMLYLKTYEIKSTHIVLPLSALRKPKVRRVPKRSPTKFFRC